MTHTGDPTPEPTPHEATRVYEPGPMLSRPGLLLLLAVAVSLLLHGGLGYVLAGRPLGRVDPDLMQAVRPPVAIKRAAYDRFEPRTAAGQGAGDNALAELAETMLDDPTAEPPADEDLSVQMRDVDEAPPAVRQEDLQVEMQAFELPASVLAELTPQRPQEPGFVRSPLGEGDSLADAHSGREQARAALAAGEPGDADGVRGVPGGISGGGGGGDPVLDARSAVPEPELPPIDFQGLAMPPEESEPIEPTRLDDDFDYAVYRFENDDAPGGLEGYFRVDITARRSLRKLETMPKDVVFLIDTSSSVPQEWVEEAVRGVEQSLPALNEGDRFNIVMFDDAPTALSTERIQPVTPQTLAEARRFLSGARSEGWTDVNAAMRRLLLRDISDQRVYMLVLISDGKPTRGVLDTRELINLITRDNDLAASIYCVAIGDEQNPALLDFLAYRNKGLAVHVRRRREAAEAIRDLMSRLRYPLIKDVRLSFAGLDQGTVYPLDLPNVHQGETFSVYGRYDSADPPRFTMRITGTSGGRPVDFTFTREIVQQPAGDKQIMRGWAFRKLHHLYSEIIRLGERPALLEEIERLRRAYGLETLY